jgi:predicted O-methyltransferase YrrM
MTNSSAFDSALQRPAVQGVLERLHALADAQDEAVIQQVRNAPAWKTASSEQRATMLRDVLLPISRDVGRFLYGIARSISAKRIVEFGTSYGVSTIYFAAALHDNGGGSVIGTELESSKVAKANLHLVEAGLSPFAEIRAGDALQTLRHTGGTVDLLFLDGWKELSLDVLHLVLGSLRHGAVVLADDLHLFPDLLAPYLDYVRNPANGFVSVAIPLGDGIEYSVKQ